MSKGRCPVCESRVNVAEFKPYSRLSCGKCHADLHISPEGRLGVGAPPLLDDPLQELKREVQRRVSAFPFQKVATWTAVVLVIGFGGYQLFGPAEPLEHVAEKASQAIVDGDPATLKALADPETVDDVERWYEAVNQKLGQFRKDWVGKTEIAEVKVTSLDQAQRKGTAHVSIRPDFAGVRDVSLADPSSATSTAASSRAFEETTDWTLTKWGRWKLDGRALAARLSKNTTR